MQLPQPVRRLEGMKVFGMLLLGVLVVACSTPSGTASPSPSGMPAGAPTTVTGVVTAGPVCPVERNPPDPSCAPRMMASAVIVATDANGREVARATTAADGKPADAKPADPAPSKPSEAKKQSMLESRPRSNVFRLTAADDSRGWRS